MLRKSKRWYFYRWSNLVYSFSKRIHHLTNYPKDTWNTVNTLKEWIQVHHKNSDIIQFVTDDDAFTDSNEVNIDIQSKIFRKVYDSNVEVDWSVLDDLKQKLIYSDTNTPLSLFEFKLATKKLILHTAPGLNGVSSNAIKSYLFRICAD